MHSVYLKEQPWELARKREKIEGDFKQECKYWKRETYQNM